MSPQLFTYCRFYNNSGFSQQQRSLYINVWNFVTDAAIKFILQLSDTGNEILSAAVQFKTQMLENILNIQTNFNKSFSLKFSFICFIIMKMKYYVYDIVFFNLTSPILL